MQVPTSRSDAGGWTRRWAARSGCGLFLALAAICATFVWRSAVAAEAPAGAEARASHVLIWVGLPGDEPHRELFGRMVEQWRKWLTERLDFEPSRVHVVPATVGQPETPGWTSTREAMEKQLDSLRSSLRPQDRLWVFLLGHANSDGQHAWFHLHGPDPRDDEIGKLFAGLNCSEQVFWLALPVAARFAKHLSRQGRVIVAASGADEDSEPEFAEALCTVAGHAAEELDRTKDGTVSVRELAQQVAAAVQARYAADERLVTEHAQLDDNGDGRGTELAPEPGAGLSSQAADGTLADETVVPFRGWCGRCARW